MVKRALCVGINDYPLDNKLKGCVNDAKDWSNLLVSHYDFLKADIKLLLDAEAKKSNIMDQLKKLLKGVKSGDVLVFTNSSHGTYVADTDGDEKLYDQALCPYDCSENLIIDDELRELFAGIPTGIKLSVISDSCFSGTVTRLALNSTPDDRRARFLDPKLLGRKELEYPYRAQPRAKELYPQSKMKDVLLSGCTNKQSSYDARIGGVYHGVMSYYALETIKAADYKITYKQLHKQLVKKVIDAEYPQDPQLEGKDQNKRKQVFV